MYEKVNPRHPDKLADRVAGAIVDLAYEREKDPKIAVEVLIGHGMAYVIIESSQSFTHEAIQPIINRICGTPLTLRLVSQAQDPHLADNQTATPRCGDNGIFCGYPVSDEERHLTALARTLYENFPTDGKYILTPDRLIICQSNATQQQLRDCIAQFNEANAHHEPLTKNPEPEINPLGPWTGGTDTDAGATNRKLGSDMGRAVTGGGLHGKDLTKADVTLNIVCHILAQRYQCPVRATCAIGDQQVTFLRPDRYGNYSDHSPRKTHPYRDCIEQARLYLLTQHNASFEHFAEWGLIC